MLALPGLYVLPTPVRAVAGWMQLLQRRPVTGGDVFDLQIVATMQANGVQRIYTFNADELKPIFIHFGGPQAHGHSFTVTVRKRIPNLERQQAVKHPVTFKTRLVAASRSFRWSAEVVVAGLLAVERVLHHRNAAFRHQTAHQLDGIRVIDGG